MLPSSQGEGSRPLGPALGSEAGMLDAASTSLWMEANTREAQLRKEDSYWERSFREASTQPGIPIPTT